MAETHKRLKAYKLESGGSEAVAATFTDCSCTRQIRLNDFDAQLEHLQPRLQDISLNSLKLQTSVGFSTLILTSWATTKNRCYQFRNGIDPTCQHDWQNMIYIKKFNLERVKRLVEKLADTITPYIDVWLITSLYSHVLLGQSHCMAPLATVNYSSRMTNTLRVDLVDGKCVETHCVCVSSLPDN